MKNKLDALGAALIAKMQGKNSYELIERDDGAFDKSEQAINFYFSEKKDWYHCETDSLFFCNGNILDIGAGAGRISLELQNQGFNVTALDISPGCIEVCKMRGIKNCYNADIISFLKETTFKYDTFIFFGCNFGILGNVSETKKMLTSLYEVSDMDSVILAQSCSPYILKDEKNILYRQKNRQQMRLPGQVRMRIGYDDFLSDWFEFLYVSLYEMKRILKGTGWFIESFIESDNGIYVAKIKKLV